jgi:DNA-binding MarR family transcriptional regulator
MNDVTSQKSYRKPPTIERYLETTTILERARNQFVSLMRLGLKTMNVNDIYDQQAYALYCLANDEMTVKQIMQRGYYSGTNASYVFAEMAKNGYVVQERSAHDRRKILIRATEKGLALCKKLDEFFDRQGKQFEEQIDSLPETATGKAVLRRLARFYRNLTL